MFGDKGVMYHQHFGDACTRVFPGCKLVLTVRHPLDTLSSYIQQPWAAFMHNDPQLTFHEQMRLRAYELLSGNTKWRHQAEVVEFERLGSEEGFRSTFARVFSHLEADTNGYEWDTAWALCRHRFTSGRWKYDAEVLAFMDWLAQRDPDLHRLLAAGAYYLQ